ncbi:hypothetical protein ACHHYP_03476 [Achlya hypogyna]|uniref:Uncharacterized protein n=1 Tax=Achlya hypogyna TaxID=1202772 RepID=A0A1V9Z3X8_ACHHY|nr:hypothetical protein ACHHYP_03476 [Achlya hypogyna]
MLGLHKRISHTHTRVLDVVDAIQETQLELKLKSMRVKQAQRQLAKMHAVHEMQLKRLVHKDLVHLERQDSLVDKFTSSTRMTTKIGHENELLEDKVTALEGSIDRLLEQYEEALHTHSVSMRQLQSEHDSLRKVDNELETIQDVDDVFEDLKYILLHHKPEKKFCLKSKHLTLDTLTLDHLQAMKEVAAAHLPLKLHSVNVTLQKRVYSTPCRRATVAQLPVYRLTPLEQLEFDALGVLSSSS